jgi:hypothetical protein
MSDVNVTVSTTATVNATVTNAIPINVSLVGAQAQGTYDHSQLQNLDYAHANHTGFQPTLVSGTNIKTINGASVLGNGDLPVTADLWTKRMFLNGTG